MGAASWGLSWVGAALWDIFWGFVIIRCHPGGLFCLFWGHLFRGSEDGPSGHACSHAGMQADLADLEIRAHQLIAYITLCHPISANNR